MGAVVSAVTLGVCDCGPDQEAPATGPRYCEFVILLDNTLVVPAPAPPALNLKILGEARCGGRGRISYGEAEVLVARDQLLADFGVMRQKFVDAWNSRVAVHYPPPPQYAIRATKLLPGDVLDEFFIALKYHNKAGELCTDIISPEEWVRVSIQLKEAAARNAAVLGEGNGTGQRDMLDPARSNEALALLHSQTPAEVRKNRVKYLTKFVSENEDTWRAALDAKVAEIPPDRDAAAPVAEVNLLKQRLAQFGSPFTVRPAPGDQRDCQFEAIADQLQYRGFAAPGYHNVDNLREVASQFLRKDEWLPVSQLKRNAELPVHAPDYVRAIGNGGHARGEFTTLFAISNALKIRIIVVASVATWDVEFKPELGDARLTIYLGLISFWHYVSLRDA